MYSAFQRAQISPNMKKEKKAKSFRRERKITSFFRRRRRKKRTMRTHIERPIK
jgi:hypothetical protein